MFLRIKQDKMTRTIDLNHVVMVHKTQFWGHHDSFMLRIDMPTNYAVVADKLTAERADRLEAKIIEAWTQGRNDMGILDIKEENE